MLRRSILAAPLLGLLSLTPLACAEETVVIAAQNYAFILKQDSPLRETINRALLTERMQRDWRDKITEYLDCDMMLPAVGQGALAVQTRRDDAALREMAAAIDDFAAHLAVRAERAFLLD